MSPNQWYIFSCARWWSIVGLPSDGDPAYFKKVSDSMVNN